MWKKLKIHSGLRIGISALCLLVSIGFVNKKQSEKQVQNVTVHIHNQDGNYFLNDADVMKLVSGKEGRVIPGTPLEELDLKQIENRVKSHKFVENAQAYTDLKGNLMINVWQAEPIARVMKSGKDLYISDKGAFIPVSDRYTARVLLLEGDYWANQKENWLQDSTNVELFSLVNFVVHDPFWRAQIAEISVAKDGDITMYPQVTKQLIEFGDAYDYKKKFKKLSIFYDRILKDKGWNYYSKVNVAYKDQIVCE